MAADRGVRDLEAVQQAERLREIACGHPHLMAVRAQRLDHGTHHEHVRAVGEVDPHAHDTRTLAATVACATCAAAPRRAKGIVAHTCNTCSSSPRSPNHWSTRPPTSCATRG